VAVSDVCQLARHLSMGERTAIVRVDSEEFPPAYQKKNTTTMATGVQNLSLAKVKLQELVVEALATTLLQVGVAPPKILTEIL
jgi:hypothetical protein